jgi:hypothetical protein
VVQQLFKRAFRVTVGDKQFGSVDEVRPLSFSFSVERDNTRRPNCAKVTLWNLNADTRATLEELSGSEGGVAVRIEAGYGDRISQIFFGGLRRVASWREGADWITEVSGGDGEKELKTAKVSRTFAKGTPVAAVLKELVGALGVDPGGLGSLAGTGFDAGGTMLTKAITMHGDAATELEAFCASLGLRWSVQDGAFFAARVGEPSIPGEGPVFSAESGLLETPSVDKDGKVSGMSLLDGDLLPGRVVRVESTRITGNFLCERTHHYGESNGDAWYVEWTGAPPAKGSRAAAQ